MIDRENMFNNISKYVGHFCHQEAYPVKLKEVHVINVSPLVDKIVNFVKPFIKDKIKERVRIQRDVKKIYRLFLIDIDLYLIDFYCSGIKPKSGSYFLKVFVNFLCSVTFFKYSGRLGDDF